MTDDTADEIDARPPSGDLSLVRAPFDTHRLRLIVLGLVTLAVLTLGVGFFERARNLAGAPGPAMGDHVTTLQTAPVDSQPGAAVVAARQAIESKINAVPDYQRFFARLKALFPADYDTTLTRLATRGASPGTGDPDIWITEAVHWLRTSHGVLAAKADGAALSRVFDMQLAMMRALGASDQHLCVDFLYGMPGSDFYKFSAANRPLVADMALAGLNAIDDGRQKRIDRTPPTDADFALLESALGTQGLSKLEIEAILDGKAANPPIEDGRMCAIGQIYLQALAGLPEPARLRIYGLAVELMARS